MASFRLNELYLLLPSDVPAEGAHISGMKTRIKWISKNNVRQDKFWKHYRAEENWRRKNWKSVDIYQTNTIKSNYIFPMDLISNEKRQHCYADQSTRPAPLLDRTPLGSVIHLPGHYNAYLAYFPHFINSCQVIIMLILPISPICKHLQGHPNAYFAYFPIS